MLRRITKKKLINEFTGSFNFKIDIEYFNGAFKTKNICINTILRRCYDAFRKKEGKHTCTPHICDKSTTLVVVVNKTYSDDNIARREIF